MCRIAINTEINKSNKHKVQALNVISAEFPKLFDYICTQAEKKYKVSPRNLEEVLEKICDNPDIFSESFLILADAANYYRKFKTEPLTEAFNELMKAINKSPYFKTTRISPSSDLILLEELLGHLEKSGKLFSDLYSELSRNFKLQISYIRSVSKISTLPGIRDFLQKIKLSLENIENTISKLNKDYLEILKKKKLIEVKISELNQSEYTRSIKSELDEKLENLREIIIIQSEVNKRAVNYQLLPLSQVIHYYYLLKEITASFDRYADFLNLKAVMMINKLDCSEVLALEKQIKDNYLRFIDISRQNFDRYLLNIVDKKTAVKSRFLEPNINNFSKKDYQLFELFLNELF